MHLHMHTFQPVVSPFSKNVSSQYLHGFGSGSPNRKSIDQLRKLQDEQTLKDCTFKPLLFVSPPSMQPAEAAAVAVAVAAPVSSLPNSVTQRRLVSTMHNVNTNANTSCKAPFVPTEAAGAPSKIRNSSLISKVLVGDQAAQTEHKSQLTQKSTCASSKSPPPEGAGKPGGSITGELASSMVVASSVTPPVPPPVAVEEEGEIIEISMTSGCIQDAQLDDQSVHTVEGAPVPIESKHLACEVGKQNINLLKPGLTPIPEPTNTSSSPRTRMTPTIKKAAGSQKKAVEKSKNTAADKKIAESVAATNLFVSPESHPSSAITTAPIDIKTSIISPNTSTSSANSSNENINSISSSSTATDAVSIESGTDDTDTLSSTKAAALQLLVKLEKSLLVDRNSCSSGDKSVATDVGSGSEHTDVVNIGAASGNSSDKSSLFSKFIGKDDEFARFLLS